jgi:hypothetical protein
LSFLYNTILNMSENGSGILKIQEVFKIKLNKQMTEQNKRYRHALKIIELLIKENEKLKINQTKRLKKTKKLSTKGEPSKSKTSNSKENSNNFSFQNKKTLNLFKKINSALNNIISAIEIITKNKYIDKISKFISKKSTDEEQKIILMETIEIVQKYVKDNMNLESGVLVDINHKPIFDLFNEILLSRKMEDNLEELKELANKNTKIKFNKTNSVKIGDLEILRTELTANQEKMKVNIDIFSFIFHYQDDENKTIKITYNQLNEKIKDCIKFIEKENNLQI